ncbi:hypothetical protein NBRC3280_0691 [Acetobacter pasteurianus NBRC 3280]|uniref:Uncharacterized protein n=1 Tax=Acetobacter pasteurianus NBRC 3278 TaxID=1226660 RepID=A0A401X1H1_ACEPA|nr:hypothetical protein NBRC3277_0783 [Acetobacter pasteurianus NBRC 3277]GCD61680.1 hypothetical protein NBRC3278_0773 [Acetobacter pasteurianus NBRC 3278]GCD68056.1 hypothetical protein NBRC3280_0691 [Acetobacter pasteurianus NBRC 3280]
MGIVNAQHTANRLDADEMVPVLVDTPADYYSDPWRLSLIAIVRRAEANLKLGFGYAATIHIADSECTAYGPPTG